MIKNHGRRNSVRRKNNFFAQIVLLSIAFIAGYGCSAFYDFSHVSAWVHQWLFMSQSSRLLKDAGVQQAVQIPKPKLEFYTLLANEQRELAPEDKILADASRRAATASVLPQVTTAQPGPLTSSVNATTRDIVPTQIASSENVPSPPKNLNHVTQKLPTLHTPPSSKIPEPKFVNTGRQETYVVQIGSFKSFYEAERMKAALVLKGFDVNINMAKQQNVTWYRVAIGPFASRQQAQQTQIAFAHKQHIIGMIRKMGG